MEYSKPELTPLELNRCKIVKDKMLLQSLSLGEIAEIANIGGKKTSQERKSREVISRIAKVYPVISLSSQKNYRVAKKDFSDIKDVRRQILELQSRAKEIELRCIPLIRYAELFMKMKGIVSLSELDRFLED